MIIQSECEQFQSPNVVQILALMPANTACCRMGNYLMSCGNCVSADKMRAKNNIVALNRRAEETR